MKTLQDYALKNTADFCHAFPNTTTPRHLHVQGTTVFLACEVELDGRNAQYQFCWVESCDEVPQTLAYIGSVVRPGRTLPSHLYGKKMEGYAK